MLKYQTIYQYWQKRGLYSFIDWIWILSCVNLDMLLTHLTPRFFPVKGGWISLPIQWGCCEAHSRTEQRYRNTRSCSHQTLLMLLDFLSQRKYGSHLQECFFFFLINEVLGSLRVFLVTIKNSSYETRVWLQINSFV